MAAPNIQQTDEAKFNIPLNDIETNIGNVHNTETPELLSSSNDDHKIDDYIEPCGGIVGNIMLSFWNYIDDFSVKYKNIIKLIIKIIAIVLVISYIGYIIKVFIDKGSPLDWCYGYGMALLILIVVLWCLLYYKFIKVSCKLMTPYFLRNFGKTIRNIKSYMKIFKISLATIFIILYCAFVIYDTRSDNRRLMSLFGIVVFILIGFIFSKHPDYIRWDTVVTGICLHLLLGLLTIKVEAGRNIFECVGSTIVRFLEYGYDGAEFVYGNFLVKKEHVFAFQSLSVLFFVSMVMQILFYLGWIQVFCFKLGGFLQFILGTTVIESVNAISTVFLGMSEAPLLYRPYIKDLTPSEVHCVMTSAFSTVAGTILAAYVSLGIDPKNVVTASIMAAPASLTFGKLFYPENQKSRTSSENIAIYKSSDASVMDAACKGAFAAVEIINGIISCVAATVSMVYFLNGISSWLGSLAGIEGLTIEYILGVIFIPLAWVMGVKPEQCQEVASLIALKTFANEFVAYEKLGKLKAAGKLTVRSEAIATYALCGFANPGSLAILIALISSLCPSQRDNVINLSLRSFISGSITSFTSACIVGLLTPENGFDF